MPAQCGIHVLRPCGRLRLIAVTDPSNTISIKLLRTNLRLLVYALGSSKYCCLLVKCGSQNAVEEF